MGLEIERKFLVAGDAWRAQVRASKTLRQGYLAREAEAASVRVRLEDDEAHLNIKAAVIGSARAEYDYLIPPGEARELLATLCVGKLEKIRHYVEHAGHTWEIDEFLGENQPLVVAEIELGARDETFVTPAWLGREVTDEQRYYNHHLALHPYASWPPSLRR
jgi:adenylate cyclase